MIQLEHQGKEIIKPNAAPKPPVQRPNVPRHFALSATRLSDTDAQQLQWLKQLFQQSPRQTWIIDCEFVVLSRACPLLLTLSIVTIDGARILNTPVDYEMFLEDMEEIVAPYLSRSIIPNYLISRF